VDNASVNSYGVRNLTIDSTLFSDDSQSVDLALFYALRYSQPEYRFNSLEVALHKLSDQQQYDVLGVELGDYCVLNFTPNNIGDAITRIAEVIRIDHNVTPERHFVEFGFRSLPYSPLILDDAEFGKLDEHSVI
jgi:hypothetical protein